MIQLAAVARVHNVPLVPRGKSTSGYGGVLPTRGGPVIDFAWMNEILTIDAEALTVIVQPGVVWDKLDKEPNKQGRALRTYPSNVPSERLLDRLSRVRRSSDRLAFLFFAALPVDKPRHSCYNILACIINTN